MDEPVAKRVKTDDDIILYSYWRSSCSYRVRIAMEMKGIKYEYEPVHLVKNGGMHHSKEYVDTLNPMQQVPSVRIDGFILTQSVAIIEYLEETRGGHKLLPAEPRDRARVRMIVEIINSGIQPLQNLKLLKMWEENGGDKMEYGKQVITEGFRGLEKTFNQVDSQYCVGDKVTIADCFLVPQVYNAMRFKVEMEQFPIISRINKNLIELEQFKSAHPSAQIDAE